MKPTRDETAESGGVELSPVVGCYASRAEFGAAKRRTTRFGGLILNDQSLVNGHVLHCHSSLSSISALTCNQENSTRCDLFHEVRLKRLDTLHSEG